MISIYVDVVGAWDRYVSNHPEATLYHLSPWKSIISKAYAHQTYYLMAFSDSDGSVRCRTLPAAPKFTDNPKIAEAITESTAKPTGILPLVHLKHFLFGNSLISLPFVDTGGILADNEEIEKLLLLEATRIARNLKVDRIELRHMEPRIWLAADATPLRQLNCELSVQTLSHKMRMILELPDKPEILLSSFKAKLRSQIKKSLKEGLTARIGNMELLDDFYDVFSANMRDLGSPVHSKKLIEHTTAEFPDNAKLIVVYKRGGQPLACSLVIGFRDTLANPWASSLRQYSILSPNMLLYWTMLEYACDQNYRYFDFGRSSLGEGTYDFKKQWGATALPLNWQYVYLHGRSLQPEPVLDKDRFKKAIAYWRKLPLPVTKILGPRIRKHIGL